MRIRSWQARVEWAIQLISHRGDDIVLFVHFVYIVRCRDGTLYTGYARDPQNRELMHNSGRGARYTAGRRPVRLAYEEAFESLSEALRREHQLKRLPRARKEALIAGRSEPR